MTAEQMYALMMVVADQRLLIERLQAEIRRLTDDAKVAVDTKVSDS